MSDDSRPKGLKGILFNLFASSHAGFQSFFAARSRVAGFKLFCPVGRMFNLTIDPVNFDLLLYPRFLQPKALQTQKHDQSWTDAQGRYDHDARPPYERNIAYGHLELVLDHLRSLRLPQTAAVMEVGSAEGWYLQKLFERGWTNLIAVEPSKTPCERLKKALPQARVHNEFFGQGRHLDETVDLCCFIGSIDRIPFANNLDALRRIKPKYVLVITGAFAENFHRPWTEVFAKMGYICTNINVVDYKDDGTPFLSDNFKDFPQKGKVYKKPNNIKYLFQNINT